MSDNDPQGSSLVPISNQSLARLSSGLVSQGLELADRLLKRVVANRSPHQLFLFDQHTSNVTDAIFSRDGINIASCSSNEILVWNAYKGTELRRFANLKPHDLTTIRFSHNETLIASAGRGNVIRIWDWMKGEIICELVPNVFTVVNIEFEPNDESLVTCDLEGNVCTWNWKTRSKENSFSVCIPGIETDPFNIFAISVDTRFVLSTGGNVPVRLWDRVSGRHLRTFHDARAPYCVTFTPSGNQFLYAGHNHKINLVDIQTGSEIWSTEIDYELSEIWFNPDFLDPDHDIQDVSEDELRSVVWVTSLAISPDGKYGLANVTGLNCCLYFDMETGRITNKWTWGTQTSGIVAFSPVQSYALSSDWDRIRFWRLL